MRAHVQRLLQEMLHTDTWGDKDRAQKVAQLSGCLLDAEVEAQLHQLPKRMCAYEFKPGDIAWNCRVCQVRFVALFCFWYL